MARRIILSGVVLNDIINITRERNTMKDKKKHHCAMNEPSSEQQFHKSDIIVFIV